MRSRLGLRERLAKPGEDLSVDEIKKGAIPKHIAIIMDGNGRWARKKGLPRIAGHRAGARAIRQVVEVAPRIGVEYITLYTFSTENWRRPSEEVSGLMQLFRDQLLKEIDELDRSGVRIRVIGRLDEVPESTRIAFLNAIERTKNNTSLNLSIALNYSGRAEIVNAARAICEAIKDGREDELFDEENFSRYLYAPDVPDPDLLIRTSGELRVSNFLLWQIAYSEIWISDKLWPDFNKQDLLQAIADYQLRRRRYGALGGS